MSGAAPLRVVIVGGGCAGMTTAYELTRPHHRGRYQVTVIQEGWRLGGKGASGRGPHGRIEEHGLHLWLGWYENAFAMMRETYGELGTPFASWRDAFVPASHVVVAHRTPNPGWELWSTFFPPLPGEPGDAALDRLDVRVPMLDLVTRGLAGLREALRYAYGLTIAGVPVGPIEQLAEAVERWAYTTTAPVAARLAEALGLTIALAQGLATRAVDLTTDGRARELAVALVQAAQALVQALVEPPIALPGGLLPAVDLGLTIARGILTERLDGHPLGFDAIDHHDFAAWLRLHGASEATVSGATVRGFYSLAFAFVDGDASRPAAAAGKAVRLLIRLLLGYRGAIFYKMRAGMGDVVFAPLYRLLQQRGVRFEFFQRVRELEVAGPPGARYVSAIDLQVQTETVGHRPYQPLVEVRGIPSWPSEPHWAQLVDGAAHQRARVDFESIEAPSVGQRRLEVGRDFDFVVLAVGAGAVPQVARAVIAADERWQQMVAHLATVATQAFQLWLRRDTEALGWRRGPATLSAYAHPFDTWAEMTHTLPAEDWPPPGPRSVAYFCNVMPEAELVRAEPDRPGFEVRARQQVLDNVRGYLGEALGPLWPRALTAAGDFDWSLLHDHRGVPAQDARALEGQHVRANVRPTERYPLCLPGSPRHRISPLATGLDNLTICGDWTGNGLDLGCVEGAVVSGKLAAHAVSGVPALRDIPGYDGP